MEEFSHAKSGMTRFPPNVEQVTVNHESTRTWLKVRRNDVELQFPMNDGDCQHLASLLIRQSAAVTATARQDSYSGVILEA